MVTRALLPLLLPLVAAPATAQNLLVNGDLEANVFSGCTYNLSNALFSAGMTGATAYGVQDEIDVMDGACLGYGPAGPVGDTRIGLATEPGFSSDALTLTMAAPLVPGASYELRFWGLSNVQPFAPDLGKAEFGLTTVAGSAGSMLWTSPPLPAHVWTQFSHSFTAGVAATELAVSIDFGQASWVWLDGFEIVAAGPAIAWNGACPGLGTLEASGMTANGAVGVGYSLVAGSLMLPGGPCAGTTIQLANPVLVAVLPADANGDAVLPAVLPPAACGGNVVVQAIDIATCTPTPLITL